MSPLPGSLQGGLNNFLNSVVPSPFGNPDLAGIAGNEQIQDQLANALTSGSLPSDQAATASAAIAKAKSGAPLDMGDSKSVLSGLVSSQYRNADGTPNGKMNPSLLGMMDGIVGGLVGSGTVPTLGTSASTVIGAAAERVFYEWGKRDANVGRVLGAGVLPVGTIIDRLLQGDFVGALGSALFGGVFDQLQGPYHNWRISSDPNDLRLRVPVVDANGQIVYLSSKLDKWPRTPAASSSVATENHIGNVGHLGHMEVSLGGLRFEIPPAIATVTPVPGGTGMVTPGAGAGIQFNHVQNIVPMLVPGSFPAYQSLGISGHIVEFVGLFLGFDHTHRLNADKHKPGWYDPGIPDPFYTAEGGVTGALAGAGVQNNQFQGGAWAVSRAFQRMIASGQPQTFELFTGVTRIRYQLLVSHFPRAYQRDDRVYYRISGFAIGGGEDVNTEKQHAAPAKKSKADKRGATTRVNNKPKPKLGKSTGGRGGSTPSPNKTPVAKSTTIAGSPNHFKNLVQAALLTEKASTDYVSLVNSVLPIAASSTANADLGNAKMLGRKLAKLSRADKSRIDAAYTKFIKRYGEADTMAKQALAMTQGAGNEAAKKQADKANDAQRQITDAWRVVADKQNFVDSYVRTTGGTQ